MPMSLTVAPQPSDVVEQQARGAARTDAERQTVQRASSKGWPQAALQEFEWQVGGKLPRVQQQAFRAMYAEEYPRALAAFLAAGARVITANAELSVDAS
jgi:hypothetical protein